MKRKQIVGLILAAAMCFGGCGSTEVARDTLVLNTGGSLTYTIISDFTDPAYDLEELAQMAQQEVTDYGQGVEISSATVEEGVLNFQYTFDSFVHYAAFMDTSCYQSSVAEALRNGYNKETKLISAKNGQSAALKELAIEGYKLFIWNEKIPVKCDGRVLYYSSNLKLTNKKEVAPKEDVTGTYYVIYK